MMPEGLIKISTNLYETVMPMVKEQVKTQLRVSDLSTMGCSIQPTECSGWEAARQDLMSTKKADLRSKLQSTLSELGPSSKESPESIRAQFKKDELEIESGAHHPQNV
jgi:hypothetical protein